MRHRPKYRLPRSGGSSPKLWYGLLALALTGLMVWMWWESSNFSAPPRTQTPVAPRTNPLAPPVSSPVMTRVEVKPAPPIAVPPVAAPSSTRTDLPPIVMPPVTSTPPVNVAKPIPPPPQPSSTWPRPVRNPFEAQLALVSQGISSGSIDGALGSQTRAALYAFQKKNHLAPTAELDAPTREKLLILQPAMTTYTVTTGDLARLQPTAKTWLGKSEQSALDYESILELVAEKSFSHPGFIRRLNPDLDWQAVAAGTEVQVPNVAYPDPHGKASAIRIHLTDKTLEAFDASGNLLVHFPCSIARRVEKRPVGELHVAVLAPNPNYTFDPEVFPESTEARELNRKLVLPPGPNNPVGVAWIGLDKPGYGIHGTPKPEEVGRTESHGCFRLANWNAAYLVRLVSVGTPVFVEE